VPGEINSRGSYLLGALAVQYRAPLGSIHSQLGMALADLGGQTTGAATYKQKLRTTHANVSSSYMFDLPLPVASDFLCLRPKKY